MIAPEPAAPSRARHEGGADQGDRHGHDQHREDLAGLGDRDVHAEDRHGQQRRTRRPTPPATRRRRRPARPATDGHDHGRPDDGRPVRQLHRLDGHGGARQHEAGPQHEREAQRPSDPGAGGGRGDAEHVERPAGLVGVGDGHGHAGRRRHGEPRRRAAGRRTPAEHHAPGAASDGAPRRGRRRPDLAGDVDGGLERAVEASGGESGGPTGAKARGHVGRDCYHRRPAHDRRDGGAMGGHGGTAEPGPVGPCRRALAARCHSGDWPAGPLPVHDARRFPDGAELDYDVCIVGTGAAGATAALALAGRGLRIAVLEGGGTAPDAVSTAFTGRRQHRARTSTRPAASAGSAARPTRGPAARPRSTPSTSRRGPGCPTRAGRSTAARLRQCYERAAALLDRPPPAAYDAPAADARRRRAASTAATCARWCSTRTPSRCGSGGCCARRLRPGDGVDVITLANVTEVRLDDLGARVAGVDVATVNGRRFVVRAPVVVLGCGAIENARLLLASRARRPAGLGNAHDVVGRYFQDHPKGFTGVLAVDPAARACRPRATGRRGPRPTAARGGASG